MRSSITGGTYIMGNFKKYITAIAFFLIAYTGNVAGQVADTVYANEEVTTEIKLPSGIDEARFVSKNSSYDMTVGSKSVIINAKGRNTKSDILQVIEGGREHSFVVVYKAVITGANILDLSTTKKLDQHNKDLAARNQGKTIEDKKDKDKPVVTDNGEKQKQSKEERDRLAREAKERDAKDKQDKDNQAREEKDKQAKDKQDRDNQAREAKDKQAKDAKDAADNKKYLAAITDGNTFLNQKNYAKAKDKFQQAKDVKPDDAYASQQMDKIDKLVLDEEQRKQQNTAAETYKNIMQNGDKAYSQGEYSSARIFYTQALTYKPGDAAAAKRIQLIDDKEKQKQQSDDLENNYNTAMSAGDKYFAAADYDNAKLQYTKAYGFIKKDAPQNQIKKINKIISDNAAQALAESKKQAKEKDNEIKYQKIIDNADNEFKKQNYAKAKQLYKDASDIKPSDPHTVDMLTKIQIAITQADAEKKAKDDRDAQEKATNKSYTAAITNGRSYLKKEDFANAKAAYTEANNLKPSEDEPKKQLAIINQKLSDIETAKQLTDKYDAKVSTADGLLVVANRVKTQGAYQLALNAFTEASNIKPDEAYPPKQIRYIQSEMAALVNEGKNQVKKQEQLEAYNKQVEEENKYQDAIKRGRDAQSDKRYEEALDAYQEALKIRYNKDYAQIVKNLQDYLEKNPQEKKKKGKRK